MKLTTPGVLETKTGHRCMQCGNEDKTYFCQYTSVILQKEIIYCRRCIQLGRMDNITDYRITESVGQVSEVIMIYRSNFPSNKAMLQLKLLNPSTSVRIYCYMRSQALVRRK